MANVRSQSKSRQHLDLTVAVTDRPTVKPLERVVLSVLEGVTGLA